MTGAARVKAAVENQQDGCGEQDGGNDDRESCVHRPAIPARPDQFQSASLGRLASKHRLRPLDRLPAEIIIGAGPGVDLGLANPAFEIAGMLLPVLFPRCGIIHSATGAGKFFDRPDAACHGATMRRRRADSSPRQSCS